MGAPQVNIRSYLESFHNSRIVGLITNRSGHILEVNSAISDLFNIDRPQVMKNKPLASFVHRNSINKFKNLLEEVSVKEDMHHNQVWMRPRNKDMFRADIKASVVMKHYDNLLIRWYIQDAGMMDFMAEIDPWNFEDV